jgi:hypothetical protein
MAQVIKGSKTEMQAQSQKKDGRGGSERDGWVELVEAEWRAERKEKTNS